MKLSSLSFLALFVCTSAHAQFLLIKDYKAKVESGSTEAVIKLIENEPFFKEAKSCKSIEATERQDTNLDKKPITLYDAETSCVGHDTRNLQFTSFLACDNATKKCEPAYVRVLGEFNDNVRAAILADLDGDGRLDEIRVVDYQRQKFDSLEIFLSASKQALSFDHLMLNGHEPDSKADYLTKIVKKGDAFEIEQSRDQGDTSDWIVTRRIGVRNGEVRLLKEDNYYHQFIMGEVHETDTSTYDFEKQIGMSSVVGPEQPEQKDEKWNFRGLFGCQISLADYDHAGLPACAQNQK